MDSSLLQALADGLGQPTGVAVGGNVADGHSGVLLGRRRGPLAIHFQIFGDVPAQHGAVAVADKLNLQVFNLFQSVEHMGVFIRPDDIVEIIFVSLGKIAVDLVVEHPRVAVVAAEAVAGEQSLFLGNPGIHGVGPVEHGRGEEVQRQPAQVDLVFFRHGLVAEGLVDDFLEKGNRGLGAEYSSVGRQLQQLSHRAGMVRLGVVDHNIIQLGRVDNLADFLQMFLKEFFLHRLKKGGFLASLQQVGIVCGAIIRTHHNVKNPQVRVQGAHPPDMFCRL